MTAQSVAFDRAADYYDATRGFPPGQEAPSVALFVAAGALTPDSRVLEIGIGTGRMALPIAKSVGVVYGVDIARPMLKRLQSKRNNERVYVAEADGTRLPIPTGSLDAVIAVHIFHLIPAWREVLSEAARVLRPGGLLLAGRNSRTRLDMENVFDTAIGYKPQNRVGVPDFTQAHFPLDVGWRPAGDEYVHQYTAYKSPQDEYDETEQRTWSHLWTLSDEQLEVGLKALKAFITAKYADPRAPIALQSSFHVQAYLPPIPL